MDMIEEQFRPRYEEICVGNKGENAQHVFFEGLLMEEGVGMRPGFAHRTAKVLVLILIIRTR